MYRDNSYILHMTRELSQGRDKSVRETRAEKRVRLEGKGKKNFVMGFSETDANRTKFFLTSSKQDTKSLLNLGRRRTRSLAFVASGDIVK